MKCKIAGREVELAIEGRVREGRASGGTTDHIHRRKPSGLTLGGVEVVRATSQRLYPADSTRSVSSNAAPPSTNVLLTSTKLVGAFTFTLQGQLPSGKNSIKTTRTGKRYPTERFVEWRDEAVGEVRKHLARQSIPYFPKPMILEIEVHYAAGDLRRRDIPGMMDALFHILERAQVVEDDAQIQEAHWYQLPIDRENPLVRVTVTVKERKG